MRSGADSEMTSGLGGARSRHHQAGARPAPRRPDGGRVRRALRDHRHPEDRHEHARPTCRCAASSRRRRRCATKFSIVEGRMFEFGTNEVVVGRGASGQLPGPDRRQHDPVGPEHLAGGRRVRDRRQHLPRPRSGATRACCRARIAAATPTRRCWRGSTRAESFNTFRDWLTREPAGQRAGPPRNRILRAAVARAERR